MRDELKTDLEEHLPDRRYTLIEDKTKRYEVVKIIKRERKDSKKQGIIKKNFEKRPYFRRLFPTIKE